MVLKVESKSSSALRKDGQSDATCCKAKLWPVVPVVEQDVRSPDLVCGEPQVLHPGVLALVPLEVVVEPALKHTHRHGHSAGARGQETAGAPTTLVWALLGLMCCRPKPPFARETAKN